MHSRVHLILELGRYANLSGPVLPQCPVPRSYLASWLEPVAPPGQTSAIHLVSKGEFQCRVIVQRRCTICPSPYKIFRSNPNAFRSKAEERAKDKFLAKSAIRPSARVL
jgi:hypothetical protein